VIGFLDESPHLAEQRLSFVRVRRPFQGLHSVIQILLNAVDLVLRHEIIVRQVTPAKGGLTNSRRVILLPFCSDVKKGELL